MWSDDHEGFEPDEPEPPEKKKRKHKTSESHHPRFKGVFVPGELWELFQAAKITPREFLLLQIVDALCNSHRGCFASNAWLAKQIRATPDHVRHMLGTMKKKKYIRQVSFDGRKRILETKWSRAKKEFRGEK